MSSVNDQTTDAISQVNALLMGGADKNSVDLVGVAGAQTLGISMYNAITAQQNAQTSTNASVTANCARILNTIPTKKPDPKEDNKKKVKAAQATLEQAELNTALDLAVTILKSSAAGDPPSDFKTEIKDAEKTLKAVKVDAKVLAGAVTKLIKSLETN